MPLNRKLRYGMVGGGPGAFIGAVHRRAAELDGLATLVAGSFSSDPDRSKEQGRALYLRDDRVYDSFEEMADREAGLPETERIDFVSIVTPNHLHFRIARVFIERGFHVVCDKPMTTTLEDAEELCRLVRKHQTVFALTHNYSGYPMIKEARALVRAGRLGKLRKVVVEYPQGWLSDLVEASGQKQAAWRTDPEKSGGSSVIGDIGSHAEHLVRYITGLSMTRLYADIHTFVEGRRLEDDANMLVHYDEGVRGILYASQISTGEENNLRIRIYGTDASLDWRQEDPNYLRVRSSDGPLQILARGNGYLSENAQESTRLPSGHPEGFHDAFANVYRNALHVMAAQIAGEDPDDANLDFPTVQDGAIGVHFIHAALHSGKEERWVDAAYSPPA